MRPTLIFFQIPAGKLLVLWGLTCPPTFFAGNSHSDLPFPFAPGENHWSEAVEAMSPQNYFPVQPLEAESR